MKTETIAAITTALSESGVGIIRVSGEDSIEIVDRIFVSVRDHFRLLQAKTHTIHFGKIMDGDRMLDEVLVSVMKGPNSYTGENVVEINCHGGVLVLQKVLELIIKNGARIAEPGEFTKRAFLNGKMDLSEAEAVMDLIASKNDFAVNASMSQLSGRLSDAIRDIRAKIIYEIAFIESALDDPENYDLDGYSDRLLNMLSPIKKETLRLIESADQGKILKEGIRTAIVGKPNAGKSSFLNKLLGEEKAIVTNIAGTTRDALEETIRLKGFTLCLTDTAGIRDTDDVVEKIGVEKAVKCAEDADLVLYIVNSSEALDENDEMICQMIRDKKVLVLMNKCDLPEVVSVAEIMDKLGIDENHILKMSALMDKDTAEFEIKIQEMFLNKEFSFNDQVIVTSMRHKEALMDAMQSMEMVERSIDMGMSEDFYAIDLMNAYSSFGRIIGEEVDDDLVNEIFAKFCMGK